MPQNPTDPAAADPLSAATFIERWRGVCASELSTAQSFVMGLCDWLGVPPHHPTPRLGKTTCCGTYTPFPDPRSHRIALADLARPEIRQRLRLIWTEPERLNLARISAEVTRDVAALLAALANSLECDPATPTKPLFEPNIQSNQPVALVKKALVAPETVASFLTRCLFSMFAEDVELSPKGAFLGLLNTYRDDPATLQHMLRILWADMDTGGFSAALAKPVLHFNGKLFKQPNADGYSLLLHTAQIDLLIRAAQANWREVEPAIFGTLLERALNPTERHALGAHYTPRAYVERLVWPTVIAPLRADWANAQAAALGDGYVQALRAVWTDVPESADFVMYWWAHAATLVAQGAVQRMGLITTNSLRQTFNRRVVQAALEGKLGLAKPIPHAPCSAAHPELGESLLPGAGALRANGGISSPGVKLHGAGFIVTPVEAEALLATSGDLARELAAPPTCDSQVTLASHMLIRDYRNGHDLTDAPRGVKVIDAFGLSAEQLRSQYPAVFQSLLTRLVALNAQRATAEAQGTVRWLRPAFQDPVQRQQQTEMLLNRELLTHKRQALEADFSYKTGENTAQPGQAGINDLPNDKNATPTKADSRSAPQPWPSTLPEQVKAVVPGKKPCQPCLKHSWHWAGHSTATHQAWPPGAMPEGRISHPHAST